MKKMQKDILHKLYHIKPIYKCVILMIKSLYIDCIPAVAHLLCDVFNQQMAAELLLNSFMVTHVDQDVYIWKYDLIS